MRNFLRRWANRNRAHVAIDAFDPQHPNRPRLRIRSVGMQWERVYPLIDRLLDRGYELTITPYEEPPDAIPQKPA